VRLVSDRAERGAAVPEFVLVLLVLLPLVFGIAQVALVMHVKHTFIAAASDGARAAAMLDADPGAAAARTRQVISTTLADRFTQDVTANWATSSGLDLVEVHVSGTVPPLGLWGPGIEIQATGHAVRQERP